jgi:hypothetical protein
MDSKLEFVFEIEAKVGAPLELGQTPLGRRRVIPIESGVVRGPGLNAIVLPGGADWQIIRADGIAQIEARYTIQADDGALISVVNCGLRHGPPEIMQRLIAGEEVDPASYYFRTTPVFEVASGPHDWLCRSVFVGVGTRHPCDVRIRVFAVR